MGVGVICHSLRGGLAEIGDDGIDFWLCEGVGEFKSCEMEILQRHKPEI